MKIADLFFQAMLDDGQLQIDAKRSGAKAGATMGGQISTSLSKTAFVGFGLKSGEQAFVGLKNAVKGVADTVQDMVSKGSDLNETMSKVRVVFGDSAGEIDRWGNTAATSLGMSKQAAEEAAGTLGNLFMGAGVAQDQLVGLSTSVVKLAADLGSFNNIDPGIALEKLRAGLVGEAEPLRTLGVNLTAAATDAKAAELGFKKVNGVFTEGQKIQARYALIVASTATAQGDFARTSDGLANSQKKLNARIEDLQARIGQKLIPIVEKATAALSAAFDILDQGTQEQGLIDQTKAFVKLNLTVGDYEKALRGVLEQKAEMDKGIATERDSIAIKEIIALLEHQIELEKGAVPVLNDMGSAAYKAFSTIKDGGPSAEDTTKRIADLTEAMLEQKINAWEATPIVAAFFDRYSIAVNKGDIAQDTLDIMDNEKAVRAARKAMEEATPGTEAYRRKQLELEVAQGRLADAHERLIDDQVILFNTKPSKKTALELDKYFQSLGLKVGDLSGDLKLAYDAVQKLLHPFKAGAEISVVLRFQNKPEARATGGPVQAGHPYLVNENTPNSEVWVPDVSGRVQSGAVPAMALGGGASWAPQVTIYNPQPHAADEDIGRMLRRLGSLGIGS